MTRCLILAGSLHAASPTITLQVSSETAPPGGTAQFKIFLTQPALVSTASISMTFDPAIFGPILNVAAFSATGDQAGYANVNGQQLTASVSSSSASLGQLPDLPIFVVTVQILPGPPPPAPPAGATVSDQPKGYPTASVTVDPTQSPWQDQKGNTYAVNVNPGTLTVQGSLSIQSVTPGGGFLPGGTVVSINGTGFDASTTATIDGVSIAATQFVSAQQINLVLDGATELTGKHLHVTTGLGLQSDFFCSLPSVPANVTSSIFPILPLATYTNVSWQYVVEGDYAEEVALLNQTIFPVTVTFFFANSSSIATVSSPMTIPPGELYWLDATTFSNGLGALAMLSSAPIRMLEYQVFPGALTLQPPTLLAALLPPITALVEPTVSPSAAAWTWQIGAPAPPPLTTSIRGGFPFTAVSSVPWVSVSPAQGTEPARLTLTPNVSGLGAGSYSGSVTIHNIVPTALSSFVQDTVIPLTMQVGATAFITVEDPGVVSIPAGSTTPVIVTFSVSTAGAQASIAVAESTSSGGNWLSATTTTGFAPGTVTFTVNPTGLANGAYAGIIVVYGPLNHVIVSVQINVGLNVPPVAANPSTLTFALAAGTATLGTTPVILSQNYATISVATQTGGNWLTATLPIKDEILASASAVGLSPGTYQGTITVTPTSGAALQIPVVLTVLTPSAPLTVTPASVSLISVAGQSVTQTFNVSSNPSTLFSFNVSTPGPERWNTGGLASSPYTPSTVTLTFVSSQPGIHYGSAIFTSGSNSVAIPIVLTVMAAQTSQPIIGSIVSAGSGLPGPIAPGEIITIYGTGLGYFLGFTIGRGGCCPYTTVQINGGTAVQTYASSNQLNVIVPPGTPSTGTASLQVYILGSSPTSTWQIPLAPSAPSIFTLSGSGVGPGAIVNQDGSINSPSNPASRGTAIQIYATGGAPSPAALTIGGVNAQVLYTGNELLGVVQINAIIPQTAPTGDVPVLLTIGGVTSQLGVTVSIF